MDRSSDKVGLLHETFKIGTQFVVFATNHVSKDNLSFFSVQRLIIFQILFKQFATTIHVQSVLVYITLYKNCAVWFWYSKTLLNDRLLKMHLC